MKKYCIISYSKSGDIEKSFQTDSPLTAINKFFSYNLKNPKMVCITCGSAEDCMKIYKTFVNESFTLLCKYFGQSGERVCYDFNWMYNGSKALVNGSSKLYFFGNANNYDQVPYFSVG